MSIRKLIEQQSKKIELDVAETLTKYPFIGVSAERNEGDKMQNLAITNRLRNDIYRSEFKNQFFSAVGGYVEVNKKTKEEVTIDGERSFIIYATTEDQKEKLKAFGEILGTKYEQDSILVKGYSEEPLEGFFLFTDSDDPNKNGTMDSIGTLNMNQRGVYYTKIGTLYFNFS